MSAISSAVAIRVLLGTQSVSTAEPPSPSVSTTVTSAPSCAATSAASYPPGPPPMITTRFTRASILANAGTPARAARGLPRYAAAVPLYAAYGSNMDPRRMGERCPHSPLQGTGWLAGWRLTFGGEEHGWDGALATIVEDPLEQVFVALYDVTDEDAATSTAGERRHRALPQDQGAGRRR